MAEVKYSGVGVVDMNGSIGNVTYSRNFYGAYAKTKKGAPASTIWLVDQQDIIAYVAPFWQLLTDDERRQWYNVSIMHSDSMAQKNTITGFLFFMSTYVNRYASGLFTIYPTPDSLAPFTPYVINNFIAFVSAGDIWVQADPVIGAANLATLFCSKPLPAGRMSYKQIYYRVILFPADGSTNAVTTNISSRVGLPSPGQKMFFKAVPNSPSGILGTPLYFSLIF
jgi:hypothetical protein